MTPARDVLVVEPIGVSEAARRAARMMALRLQAAGIAAEGPPLLPLPPHLARIERRLRKGVKS